MLLSKVLPGRLQPEVLGLSETFKQYFQIVPVFSQELRTCVYRIRHQVYCEELDFEPKRPDRLEHDEYDAHSLHLLIRSVHTKEFIGCTRVIRYRPEEPAYPLPFEKTCGAGIDRSIVDPGALPRNSIAEISRLAVVGSFRNRKGERKMPLGVSVKDFDITAHPRFPYIPIALYLGAVELARLHGIETLFVLTEARLASHFRKLGVNVQAIGAPIEHRGERIPSMMSTSGIIGNLRAILRPLYRTIAADIAQDAVVQTKRIQGQGLARPARV